MSQPTSRQELYDRIRASSKDEVILAEMIRLGFWPAAGSVPHDPADEIRRRGELEREIRALGTEATRLQDVEALKREARRRRLLESRQKQKETKERRERERIERAERWAEKKETDLLFLGTNVSGGLNDHQSDVMRLQREGLPVLSTASEVAKAMGLTIGRLRFLAFDRKVSRTSHYVKFVVPKKAGGKRKISAPMPRLKSAQHWLLEQVLAKVKTHEAAHGFITARNIVSNAGPHSGARVVINVDLADFFPTLGYRRVKGMFEKLGYSGQVATIFALLATEPDTATVELDGKRYHIAMGERRLPQGAPTSPAVTNIICRRLDRRISGVAKKLGFTYTRYADDLTFSAASDADVGRLLRRVRFVVKAEGFEVHPAKTRVLRRGRRQEVTGLVVNDGKPPRVPRSEMRKFRAVLFQLEKDGPEGKRWGKGPDVLASVHGFASFVAMVDPEKGRPLVARAKALLAKHGKTAPKRPVPAKPPPPKVAEAPATPIAEPVASDGKKPWWKFW
jgi:retron-type reverse transcriptase